MTSYDLDAMTAERPLRFGERSATGHDYFDYKPGQPNLYLMMRFKRLLAEKLVEAGLCEHVSHTFVADVLKKTN